MYYIHRFWSGFRPTTIPLLPLLMLMMMLLLLLMICSWLACGLVGQVWSVGNEEDDDNATTCPSLIIKSALGVAWWWWVENNFRAINWDLNTRLFLS